MLLFLSSSHREMLKAPRWRNQKVSVCGIEEGGGGGGDYMHQAGGMALN